MWRWTYCTGIPTGRWQLYHLHHLCSAHASLGTGLEKESPAKQGLVALSHLLSRSKWSMWVGAHGPDPASGWLPCSLLFLLWPQSAAEVGRKEKQQTHNCFAAFSYLTTKKGLSLDQSRRWQAFPWTGLQSTALKTCAFLLRMQTSIHCYHTNENVLCQQ